ncbi:hypothetical protein ASD65_13660 [Microbacterium sp. Root61]|uniref:mechanosensitive ion channel family protein n=1 Tax=Microbacterium sp. Root61 TaxID=1736570 RepID=UPI0007009A6B|nr:mechanosensitive ion channel domain-containing protein [Microbacterium sp. Root61]KRA25353.1 hypothetical protein ASD65_13660 [Microbacterium sp. Root61]
MDFSQFVPDSVDWWNVVLALIVVIVGWILSRLARRGVLALAHRAKGISESMAQFASRFASYTVILLAIGVGLALMGANVQPLLAMVIILAVVIVLVLRGIADNFAAGVIIQTRHPVKVGDEIQIEALDGVLAGTVIELNSRSVVFVTVDGRTVHAPNSMMLSNPIVNDSTHGARRSEVHVRTERGDRSVEELMTVLTDAAASVDGVHQREHPRGLATAVSPDRLTARLQYWHHPLHAVPVTADVVVAVAAALETGGLKAVVTSVTPPLTPSDAV